MEKQPRIGKHGWYSEKQATCIEGMTESRAKPYKVYWDVNKEDVVVTMVSEKNHHEASFDDMKYRGIVYEYIRSE